MILQHFPAPIAPDPSGHSGGAPPVSGTDYTRPLVNSTPLHLLHIASLPCMDSPAPPCSTPALLSAGTPPVLSLHHSGHAPCPLSDSLIHYIRSPSRHTE